MPSAPTHADPAATWRDAGRWRATLIAAVHSDPCARLVRYWLPALCADCGLPETPEPCAREHPRSGARLAWARTDGGLCISMSPAPRAGIRWRARVQIEPTGIADAWSIHCNRQLLGVSEDGAPAAAAPGALGCFAHLAALGTVLVDGLVLRAEGLYALPADRRVYTVPAEHPILVIRAGKQADALVHPWLDALAPWLPVFVARTHAMAQRLAADLGCAEVPADASLTAFVPAAAGSARTAWTLPLRQPAARITQYASALLDACRAAPSSRHASAPRDVAAIESASVHALQDAQALVASTREQIEAAESRAEQAEQASTEATSAAQIARTQFDGLRSRNAELERQLAAVRPPLGSWMELAAWSGAAFSGRLVLTAKALDAAERSVFTDYSFVADVLDLLATDYRDMRLGVEGAFARCEARKTTLGVTLNPVGEAIDNHRYRAAYQARWGDRTYLLDLHVQGTSARFGDRMFRVYFAWDDVRHLVIVGSLPEHLRNRAT